MVCPKAVHPAVHAFVAKAFIGLPCPKKIAGIRVLIFTSCLVDRGTIAS
jgi:hypothetical protein